MISFLLLVVSTLALAGNLKLNFMKSSYIASKLKERTNDVALTQSPTKQVFKIAA